MLVLAIAGLIFLMMTIALPSLFANQRDAKRRDDVALFINRLKNFQANNNRGALPGTDSESVDVKIAGNSITFGQTTAGGRSWADFYAGFFDNSFVDPSSGGLYDWYIVGCGTTTVGSKCSNALLNSFYNGTFESNNFTMYIVKSASCSGSDPIYSSNARNVAVLYKLERGEYCANT